MTALVSRIQRLEAAVERGQVLAKGRAPGTEEPTRLTAKDAPPWEETPAPQPDALTQADMSRPEEPEEQVLSVPEQPKEPSATNTVVGSGWWRALAESCKGRLPPMYRVFLDMCTGVLEGDQLTLYAPDEITKGRLDNDRVKKVLLEEAATAAGTAVRLVFHIGPPPQASPQENLQNLLKFGSQFDNIEIK